MKNCISKIIYLASKLVYLWRTVSRMYACRKCRHMFDPNGVAICHHCKVIKSTKFARQLPTVGRPTKWEKR